MPNNIIILNGPHQRLAARRMVNDAPRGWVITARQATRSNLQNAKMWPLLEDVARHVVWHGEKLAKEDWKEIFTAALKKSKVVRGIDGGFVVLTGASSSTLSKDAFSDLIEIIYAFGSEHGVKWSEKNPYDR